jgi:murein DD-endopeptidase MepM/ murein hydrolase activator NlpD
MRAPLDQIAVTSPFGMRNGKMHNGVDFRAGVGTPIYAPFDGYVTINFTVPGGNQLFVKDLSGQYVAGFAHLESYVRSRGYVREGDLIGYTGNTGISTGPHLHFTLTINGEKVDPMPYISHPEQKNFSGTHTTNLPAVIGALLLVGIAGYFLTK